ncbi:MAG: hypothetical protein ACYC1D_05390 [Acidimicrobiales bacterium]
MISVLFVIALFIADLMSVLVVGRHGPAFPQVSQAGAEPWINSPPPPFMQLQQLPSPPPPPHNAPACQANSLQAAEEGSNGLAGALIFYVKITNVSSFACSLSGYPTSLTGVETATEQQPIALYHLTSSGGIESLIDILPSNLAPGASGLEDLISPHDCTATASGFPGGIRLGLPGRGTLSVQAGSGFDDEEFQFPCGEAEITSLGVMAPPARFAARPLQDISASIVAPPSVRAGDVLTYIVIIGNPTSYPISLSSCPGYREVLDGAHDAVVEEHALNCKGLSALAPHASQRFVMKIRTHSVVTSRTVTLAWMADYTLSNDPVAYITLVKN